MNTTLLNVLEHLGINNISYLRDVLAYVNVKEELEDVDSDYIIHLLDHLDDNGAITDEIDTLIDIYYHDLEKWVVGNAHYITEAREEGLFGDDGDFHSQIQAGQYVYYSQQVHGELYDIQKAVESADFSLLNSINAGQEAVNA